MINLEKIKNIKLSLMKRKTDINEGRADYDTKMSASFKVPDGFLEDGNTIKELVTEVYKDIMKSAPTDIDSIGLWVKFEDVVLENAISIQTLEDIAEYSERGTSPIYEFFKMTIPDLEE